MTLPILFVVATTPLSGKVVWSHDEVMAQLSNSCVSDSYLQEYVRSCRLLSIEPLGDLEDSPLYRGRYRLEVGQGGHTYTEDVVTVFEVQDGRGPQRVLAVYGEPYALENPLLTVTAAGPLIRVPAYAGQTAVDAFWLRVDGVWREVDSTSWLTELPLPDSCAPAAQVADLEQGIFHSPVRHLGDCSACATCGQIEATVTLQGARVALVTASYTPPVD